MPAIPPLVLVDSIISAFSDAGCQASLISSIRAHPRKFQVVEQDGNSFMLWIYVWTITHGGNHRSTSEYRIQMTSVSSPLPMNPDGPTVLIGWYPDLNVFGGFDLSKHKAFTTGSPSVQISLSALQSALNFGFGFSHKDNGEIAVAFRSEQILNYIKNATSFHTRGTSIQTVNLLQKVARLDQVEQKEIESEPSPRQKLIQTVSRLARNANFRDKVLDAYGKRCVVTRAQLKLIDAAHIFPVGALGSTDQVTNGLALSPTYHRAFDQGLIYLDTNFVMKLNPNRVKHLETLKLSDGLADFSHYLNRVIHLPADIHSRPSVLMIKKANEFRNISNAS